MFMGELGRPTSTDRKVLYRHGLGFYYKRTKKRHDLRGET